MNRKVMYPLAVAVTVLISSAPLRASDNDDKIESAFEKTYVAKTYLKNDSIKAEVEDGVMTLTGTVSAESHKTLAQETAASLPGVTRVNNQLATKAQVAAENADAWIGDKVKLALMFHRNVNASKTDVDVKDGVVTLTGEASSIAQKELTTEYAKDIDKVVDVRNQMLVAAAPAKEERTAGEKLDDASVTAEVKTALLTHRSTSAVQTKVETRNGVVTLTGIAKNDAEKSLVTKLISDIQGVNSVDNQMTIEVAKTK